MSRRVLFWLLALSAMSAFGGGLFGLLGAPGVPLELLAGTPFRGYWFPSLFLFGAVGGSLAWAAVAVRAEHARAGLLALGAGLLLVAWIAVQVAAIGFLSWLQPVSATVGVVIAVLARRVPR